MSDTSTGGRGGYRRPTSPAPVSGPGALSRRTDGGPAGQPVQVAPGATQYGQAQQLEAGQQVAPLAAAGASPAHGGGAGAPPSPQSGASLGGLFTGPTQAPGEPLTAGAMTGPGPGPSQSFADDPDELLRVIYSQHPSEDLRSLLEGRDLY
jgi:hypothetical protein